jgi:hypothetical protein
LPARVVALGASNLTRGLQTVVAAAREEFGRDVEILAALGHGRSYGADSQFLARTLPGILQSGLWRALDALPASPTRAIVSDVGNDILYGYSAPQILEWVHEAVDRLQRHTNDIVIAGLPHSRLHDLAHTKFLLMRTVLFPACRLTLAEVAESAVTIEDGLARLAGARGLRFVPMDPAWYGFDPIHIRPSLWQPVWRQMLRADAPQELPALSRREWIHLYRLRPERRRMFGIEQVTPQRGHTLASGGRVWLF